MEQITRQLFALQDEQYRRFHGSLMPDYAPERIIGVRVPALRGLAKSLDGALADEFLRELPHRYYEENNLHAFLLERIRDFPTSLAATERFLPFVDNWATCDALNPRTFAAHRTELLPEIDRWLASAHIYTVRFGIVQLMRHYLDDAFTPQISERVAALRSEEYYIQMAAAWFFATALAKRYDATLPYLTERRLPDRTHNKTIQKAIESYRVTPEQKAYLRTLRVSLRKGGQTPCSQSKSPV